MPGKSHKGVLGAIGNTPLVRLQRISESVGAEILVKLEYYNPSGSLKDRIYLKMIEAAEMSGELKPGMTIIEASTGNAGVSAAMIGAIKGYKVIICMPEGMSEERKKIIRAYGAELTFTPGAESDVDLVIEKVQEIKAQAPTKYWEPAQFSNPNNWRAHYETTGPEIFKQAGEKIDAFIASQGTGGTITGVGKYLRERIPEVKLYAIEPAECPLLSQRRWGTHRIEGIGDGFIPLNLEVSILDGVITTTSQEALEMAQRLAREEGIFCGISSGCNIAGILKLLKHHPEFQIIVTMINDDGLRYFSTPLCGVEKELEIPHRHHPIAPRTLALLDRYQSKWEIIN